MAVTGRPGVIDRDPRRREIVAAITGGASDVEVSERFAGVSESAVRRYRAKMVAEAKAKAKQARALARKKESHAEVLKAGPRALEDAVNRAVLQEGAAGMLRTADAILTALEKRHATLEKLFDACDRFLEDPADPTRYSLAPRTTEIAIHVGANGRGQKTTLGELLNRAEVAAGGLPVTLVENGTKTADPRRLIRETAETCRGVAETLAKVAGLLKPETQVITVNQFLGSPEWLAVQATLVEPLREYPAAAEKVAAVLEAVGRGGNGR